MPCAIANGYGDGHQWPGGRGWHTVRFEQTPVAILIAACKLSGGILRIGWEWVYNFVRS
jgi:hypothetical protein